jgi:hypothetical protein
VFKSKPAAKVLKKARQAAKAVIEKRKVGAAAPKPTFSALRPRPQIPMRHVPPSPVVKRVNPALTERRRTINPSTLRSTQFNFMKAPTPEHAFEVGDNVEVFCDHEKSRERVRGWIKGIVVQVDNKMVAVQFRSNVFLTDGWMVPDRILWYPLTSEHIRPVMGKKPTVKKDLIPDY